MALFLFLMSSLLWFLLVARYLFFFQAEDGIRDWSVTGVQTCALPISLLLLGLAGYLAMLWHQSRHYARTYPAPDAARSGAGRFWSGTLLQILVGLGLLSLDRKSVV